MKYFHFLIMSTILLSCANTGQKNLQQGEPQKQLVEKKTVNSFLKDSVYCTELFRNSKLVSWAIPDFDVQPIITITENHFSYDQDLNGAHLYGQLKDERKFHGKKNRQYRFDVVFRDTTITNYDFELYELAKDCFGKDAEFPTSHYCRNGERYGKPNILGQRIYMDFSGTTYADIIEESELSRTYRTNKKLDPTDLRDLSYYYDIDLPSKFFVLSGSKKPYAKVEHWKDPNRLVIYNYSANTYFVLDYKTLDIIERDHIN